MGNVVCGCVVIDRVGVPFDGYPGHSHWWLQ